MDKFYLIGIKGSGMSSLANILFDLGYVVDGSDKSDYFFTEDLLREKQIVINEYSENNIKEGFIYIKGNSVDNEEVMCVKNKGYKMYSYNEFINEFFKGVKIAVSGTHGKTTTCMMIAHILKSYYKTTYLVGDGTGVGEREYTHFVFEACEYKDHFLAHNVDYGVITNIDFDHPDYFNSLSDVQNSFDKFSLKANEVVINGKYNVKNNNQTSFGFSNNYDVSCKVLYKDEMGYKIKIDYGESIELFLPFYGEYMIENFLATFTLCLVLGIPVDHIKKEILTFRLPKRRFTEYLINSQVVIDDYAHHPNEIKASLSAIRQKYSDKLIALTFQPHTYSRTRMYKDEFVEILSTVDVLFIDSVFSSARELESNEEILIDLIENSNKYSLNELGPFIGKKDYILVFMGAGDINNEINKLYIDNHSCF
ncbi:Mur ligase family protein [Mycoplasmatota bacterium zrk1]